MDILTIALITLVVLFVVGGALALRAKKWRMTKVVVKPFGLGEATLEPSPDSKAPTSPAGDTIRKRRRIDAAAPSHAEIGQHIDVLVQVRFSNSSLLGFKDWPTRRKPSALEQTSEPVTLAFPVNPQTGKTDSVVM